GCSCSPPEITDEEEPIGASPAGTSGFVCRKCRRKQAWHADQVGMMALRAEGRSGREKAHTSQRHKKVSHTPDWAGPKAASDDKCVRISPAKRMAGECR